jgi:hypothetical protein
LEDACRLLRHVTEVAAANPNIWRRVDEVRAARSRRSALWPSWCFLPLSERKILAREFPAIGKKMNLFDGVSAWRPTQGIYVFDRLLVDELSKTQTNEAIPSEVLLQMPEWCIYITVAEGSLTNWGPRGYFAFLTFDDLRGQPALQFLLDMTDESLCATFPIWLNAGSIAASIHQARAEAVRILAVAHKQDEVRELLSLDYMEYTPRLGALMDLVLYICSENADIIGHQEGGGVPRHPMATRTRQGPRLFPPEQVAIWEVGTRVAAAIRTAQEEMKTLGGSVRPHVRRAHWHAYWTGSRAEPDVRALRVKWLPPILVNANESGGASAVRIIRQKRRSGSLPHRDPALDGGPRPDGSSRQL